VRNVAGGVEASWLEAEGDLYKLSEIDMDFSKVEYISSSGLRMMLWLLRSMKVGGTSKVHKPNEITRKVFEVTGFDKVVSIVEHPSFNHS